MQFVCGVKIEPRVHAEPRAQRRADHARARGRADERKFWQVELDAARIRPLVDDDVEFVILHRGVEVFLDGRLEAVDFVDKKNVAAFERGEQAGEVSRFFNRGAAGGLDVHPHRVREDVGEGCFSEAGRAAEQNVLQHVAALLASLDHEFEALADFFLPGEFAEHRRTQRDVDCGVLGSLDEFVLHAGIEDLRAANCKPQIPPHSSELSASLRLASSICSCTASSMPSATSSSARLRPSSRPWTSVWWPSEPATMS